METFGGNVEIPRDSASGGELAKDAEAVESSNASPRNATADCLRNPRVTVPDAAVAGCDASVRHARGSSSDIANGCYRRHREGISRSRSACGYGRRGGCWCCRGGLDVGRDARLLARKWFRWTVRS